MKKFLFVYEGGESPKDELEGKSVMQKWLAWFDSLGSKVVEGGFPTKSGARVVVDMMVGNSHLPVTGYSVIQAESMEEAVIIAKTCPHVSVKGKVHVFEEEPVNQG